MSEHGKPRQPHKWAKEIKAWADGAEIEIKYTLGAGSKSGWMTESNPNWNFDECEYRIKPQPKPDVYLYVYQNPDLRMGVSMYTKEYKGLVYTQKSYIGKIKLEQDDEDKSN